MQYPDIAPRAPTYEELESEVSRLRTRVEELTRTLAEREERARESLTLLRVITDNAPALLYAKDLEGRFILMNQAAAAALRRLSGQTEGAAEAFLGRSEAELVPAEIAETHRRAEKEVSATGMTLVSEEEDVPFPDGARHHLVTRFPLRDAGGAIRAVGVIALDVSAHREAEAQNRRLEREILRLKDEALRALSTPLLPIARGVLVLPLVGYVDRGRADLVLETLLAGVSRHGAKRVILDVTGVPIVDTHVASALMQAARAVGLLGARVILTGIQPAIARTLVELGVDLGDIATKSTLESGIASALGR